MKIRSIILITIVLFLSCQNENNKTIPPSEISRVSLDTSVKVTKSIQDTVSKINYRDSAGLKQGRWETYDKKGNVIFIETFLNDTLHGYYFKKTGVFTEGHYCKGLRSGYFFEYYGQKRDIMLTSYFENDKELWSVGYAAEKEHLILEDKGVYLRCDSVYVKAPHLNGKLWYEGMFNRKYKLWATGIHRVYFESGKLRAIIDYDKKLIEEYTDNGDLLYKTDFADFNTHKQDYAKYFLRK